MAQDAFRNMIIKRVIVHQVFRRDTDNKVRNPFFSSECVTLSDDFNTKMKERIFSTSQIISFGIVALGIALYFVIPKMMEKKAHIVML